LDSRGRPYGPPRDPLKGSDKEARARAVAREIPVSLVQLSWTVSEIRSSLDDHAVGLFQSSGMLAEAIMGDDRVTAALGSRVGALFGLPTIYAKSDADDGSVRDAWKTAWNEGCPKSVREQIKRIALVQGFCVSQIVWDTEVTPWRPYVQPWDPQNLYYDHASRTMIAITLDGPEVVVPGDGRWFVHAPHGVHRGWLQGLVRPLALPWLLRNLAFRDWARYSERHGLPMLKAMIPSIAEKSEKEAFVDSLATMGTEAVVALPQGIDGEGFDVSLIEATSQSWEGFDRLITRCDSAITLCVQWQNLTTEVKEGSLAAARVHGDVKQTAIEFDNATFSADVDDQVARPFTVWNYGDEALTPRTYQDTEPLEDRAAALAALESFGRAVTALRAATVDFDVDALADAYRVKRGRARFVLKAIDGGAKPAEAASSAIATKEAA
jgi:hypothetical protein